MDFIDKEHILITEIGQDGGQVSGTLYRRARSNLEVAAYLGSYDVGQGSLAQPGWAIE